MRVRGSSFSNGAVLIGYPEVGVLPEATFTSAAFCQSSFSLSSKAIGDWICMSFFDIKF